MRLKIWQWAVLGVFAVLNGLVLLAGLSLTGVLSNARIVQPVAGEALPTAAGLSTSTPVSIVPVLPTLTSTPLPSLVNLQPITPLTATFSTPLPGLGGNRSGYTPNDLAWLSLLYGKCDSTRDSFQRILLLSVEDLNQDKALCKDTVARAINALDAQNSCLGAPLPVPSASDLRQSQQLFIDAMTSARSAYTKLGAACAANRPDNSAVQLWRQSVDDLRESQYQEQLFREANHLPR